MKPILLAALWLGSTWLVSAVDRPLGRLPNGQLYIKDEIEFCLRTEAARSLSPAGPGRRPVNRARLAGLHPAVARVVGNHSSAARWLNGEPLPPALRWRGDAVPAIARSLTAQLNAQADAAVVVEELRRHPDVEWASLNFLHPLSYVPNDPLWTNQWGPMRIGLTNGWEIVQPTATLAVAIIDSGVDLQHPDLAPRIVYNKGFAGNTSGDAMRDARGGTSLDHGTHVAGTAAAIRDNNLGIAGVAQASIMAMGCAVWDGTKEYRIGSAEVALNDAIANGATAVNCSFGQAAPLSPAMKSALDNAQANGVLVICAAGNDGTNILNSPSAGWAAHPWPILVSNVQQGDALYTNSNFGSRVDLAAPGTSIFSTVTTNFTAPSPGGGTYGLMTGTSMASPHVAGASVLVRSMNDGFIQAVGARDLLFRMAQDLGPAGIDPSFGFGILQLPASFLGVLRKGTRFAGTNSSAWVPDGSYDLPYPDLPAALLHTPSGGTLVLNGGVGGALPPNYAAQTINQAVTLSAFPDRPVTIGK